MQNEHFPKCEPKNHFWRLPVDFPNLVRVFLYENLDTLKCQDFPISLNVEIWYVGGNNTGILNNLSQVKLKLPI